MGKFDLYETTKWAINTRESYTHFSLSTVYVNATYSSFAIPAPA